METYLTLGCGVYIGLAVIRYKSFTVERWPSIALGLLGCIFAWPIMLYLADKE